MENKSFIEFFNELAKEDKSNDIWYIPEFARLTGSAKSGLLISYFYQKSNCGKIHPIRLTNKQIEKDLNFSRGEVIFAKKKIKELDFVEIKREGHPSATWYYINWSKIITKKE